MCPRREMNSVSYPSPYRKTAIRDSSQQPVKSCTTTRSQSRIAASRNQPMYKYEKKMSDYNDVRENSRSRYEAYYEDELSSNSPISRRVCDIFFSASESSTCPRIESNTVRHRSPYRKTVIRDSSQQPVKSYTTTRFQSRFAASRNQPIYEYERDMSDEELREHLMAKYEQSKHRIA